MKEDIDVYRYILAEKYLPDGRKLTVEPRLFGAQMGIGEYPPYQESMTYADTWDFPTEQSALGAFENWNAEQEPTGWHRHQETGRYRREGNPDLEYIRWQGTDEQQIKHALHVLRGNDRFLTVLREEDREPVSFPDVRIYHAETESNTCSCLPSCVWGDHAFLYLDRCVLLSRNESVQVSVAMLKKRLYG